MCQQRMPQRQGLHSKTKTALCKARLRWKRGVWTFTARDPNTKPSCHDLPFNSGALEGSAGFSKIVDIHQLLFLGTICCVLVAPFPKGLVGDWHRWQLVVPALALVPQPAGAEGDESRDCQDVSRSKRHKIALVCIEMQWQNEHERRVGWQTKNQKACAWSLRIV